MLALLTSIGYGVLSAVVPLVNAEAYVIASQVSAVAGAVPVAVGVGDRADHRQVSAVPRCTPRPGVPVRPAPAPGSGPSRVGRPAGVPTGSSAAAGLVGTKRWGLPIILLAAVVGLPPLYAVALLAGATTMRLGWFALVVLVGRITRFVLVAYGVAVLPFRP